MLVEAVDKRERTGKSAVGKSGEEAAVQWLESHGFTVLDRNWRSHHLELDIIARTPRALHIVEVKTRSLPGIAAETLDSAATIDPAAAVDQRKQARLVAAASRYIALNHIALEVQFDIISVILDPAGHPSVEYIPSAFFPITYGR